MNPFSGSLCIQCEHVRRTENKRGSVFLMCGKSKEDERFAKYPPQPVERCLGFLQAADSDAASSEKVD
jgi:hypothetical protein